MAAFSVRPLMFGDFSTVDQTMLTHGTQHVLLKGRQHLLGVPRSKGVPKMGFQSVHTQGSASTMLASNFGLHSARRQATTSNGACALVVGPASDHSILVFFRLRRPNQRVFHEEPPETKIAAGICFSSDHPFYIPCNVVAK